MQQQQQPEALDISSLHQLLQAKTESPAAAVPGDSFGYPPEWGRIHPASHYGLVEHDRTPFNFQNAPSAQHKAFVTLPADTVLNTAQAGISAKRVSHYKRNGVLIAPLLYCIDGQYWVADGHHRLAAILPAVRKGERTLQAEVHTFT